MYTVHNQIVCKRLLQTEERPSDTKEAMANSLRIKPTDAPNSNIIGITTLHVSGSLSAHHQ